MLNDEERAEKKLSKKSRTILLFRKRLTFVRDVSVSLKDDKLHTNKVEQNDFLFMLSFIDGNVSS